MYARAQAARAAGVPQPLQRAHGHVTLGHKIFQPEVCAFAISPAKMSNVMCLKAAIIGYNTLAGESLQVALEMYNLAGPSLLDGCKQPHAALLTVGRYPIFSVQTVHRQLKARDTAFKHQGRCPAQLACAAVVLQSNEATQKDVELFADGGFVELEKTQAGGLMLGLEVRLCGSLGGPQRMCGHALLVQQGYGGGLSWP